MPDIAQPLPYTLLSLPEYAQIMGINPVHFAGATAGDIFPIQGGGGRNACEDVWHRYSWQNVDSVSHYDLAETIQNAEYEIARELGWWPAPMWISQEIRQYPRYHRPDAFRSGGGNVRLMPSSVRAMYGKIIAGGRRNVDTKIGTVTTAVGGGLTYTDVDLDGFAETATVEIATTLTDETEVKVYVADTDAALEWEIRQPRSKVIAGGVFTAVFDSWLFIDPDIYAAYPTTADPAAIDISTTANYVTSVDVYREYNDPTYSSAEFYWEPTPSGASFGYCSSCGGSGCVACTHIVQNGCLHIRDANVGWVVPQSGTYDESTAQWSGSSWSVNRDPDFVKIWYYCGDLSQEYLSNRHHWTLPRNWARAIAYLATCRLERPFCSCGNAGALAERMRDDLAAVSSTTQQARSYRIDPVLVLQNPFGTLRGEVTAWQQVVRSRERITGGGAA